MSKVQTKPQYVNLQATAVQVYDEKRHAVTVLPWGMRHKNPNGQYVVEGAHYQQFVSGRGPLYPFPVVPDSPPGPLGETADSFHARMVAEANQRAQSEGLQNSANRSKIRVAASLVRDGQIVGETQEAFAARLRQGLVAAGVLTEVAFNQAPRETLLKIEGISTDNIMRVREMGAMIYADAALLAQTSGKSTKDEAPKPVTTTSTVTTEGEPDADQGPFNSYSRKAVDRMSREKLVKLIQDEGFELKLEGTAAEIRAKLIDALVEYEMLTD